MAVLSTINGYGTHAARPAAGTAGATYFETDTGLLFRDSGSAWQSINLASLATTKGDLLAATGAGAVARVGVGTDGLPVVADSSQTSGLNYGGVVGGTAFAPSGLTGSVAASRYVGATASVAPTTGAHLLGDWVTTQDGKVFICTTAGTPGTWTQAGGSGTFAGEVAGTDFAPTGLTGSTAASRYVGATASGAPASGAHLLGDYVIDQTGFLYVCTTAGTPGTWTKVGGSSGAMVQVSDTTLGSPASSLALTSLAGYTTLLITLDARCTTTGGGGAVLGQMNGDTGSNYDSLATDAFASSTPITQRLAATSAAMAYCNDDLVASNSANTFSTFNIWLVNYGNTEHYKTFFAQGTWIQAQASGDINVVNIAGEWRSTSAITSLTLTPPGGNFKTGTRVSVYGLT